MERKLILRGGLAGALAGLLAFVFARIFAEPQINAAIAYESGRDAAQSVLDEAAGRPPADAGPDIFSRTVQANVGIGVGMVFFGVAMGVLFAVVYAILLGRVGSVQPRNLALLVAGGGFLGIYFVPFLKYPANPPSIGHPDTIRDRGNLYLGMVLCSVMLLIGAVVLGKRLRGRFGNWNATLLAGAAFAVVIGIVMAVLPATGELSANVQEFGRHATETPLPLTNARGVIVYPGFPADTLFDFRLSSIIAQVILWTALGLAFGPLAERVLNPRPRPEPVLTEDAAPAPSRPIAAM
jgi:hypothetical protein